MQGICCKDLDIIFDLPAKKGKELKHLLPYGGRYHPQENETTANGIFFWNFILVNAMDVVYVFRVWPAGKFPTFRKKGQSSVILERNNDPDFSS